MNHLKLIEEKLSVEAVTELAASAKCGAISVFVGTTRDSFEEKTVVNLEYEAYENMALKALEEICREIRKKWAEVENIAIFHRLGVVPVKESSIIIAISAPHRKEAIEATQWCIDNVKKSVPIWKKEVYSNDEPPEWKENKECVNSYPPNAQLFKLPRLQEVETSIIPPHLIQIQTGSEEIEQRIRKFIERKRDEINKSNIRDFCFRNPDTDDEHSCARIDAKLVKRKDSKGHLQVNRVLNTYTRSKVDLSYMTKHMPVNGIEERVHEVEVVLNMHKAVPKDIYKRLREIENRLLYLESVSPEYLHFWNKGLVYPKKGNAKRVFSVDEVDALIDDLKQKKIKTEPRPAISLVSQF